MFLFYLSRVYILFFPPSHWSIDPTPLLIITLHVIAFNFPGRQKSWIFLKVRDSLVLILTMLCSREKYVNFKLFPSFSLFFPLIFLTNISSQIASLTLMKDSERLDLLKEIGGTRVYEERRRESLKIMQETGKCYFAFWCVLFCFFLFFPPNNYLLQVIRESKLFKSCNTWMTDFRSLMKRKRNWKNISCLIGRGSLWSTLFMTKNFMMRSSN